jgi:hypothetical protein
MRVGRISQNDWRAICSALLQSVKGEDGGFVNAGEFV